MINMVFQRLCILTLLSIHFVVFLNVIKETTSEAPLLGPADFILKNIEECQNPESYPNRIIISRRKLNRTMDAFSADIILLIDVDDTVAIDINVAKWGDGGYKPNYLVLNDTNACDFAFKWLSSSMKEWLRGFGRPESCPILKGEFKVMNHLVDYSSLPDEMVYGEFKATVLLVQYGVNILCYEWFVSSKPKLILG